MKKVFVGMSGGVDSSVAAALCKQQGYEVTGVYMKNWTQDVGGTECPWREDLADAKSVAARLDIPFLVFDFETEYRQRVVDYMINEYKAGRTPNPDIMCNQEVKFKLFLDMALEYGADAIATGHYARTSVFQGGTSENSENQSATLENLENSSGAGLYQGVDENKDQSYFLYRVTAEALSKTLFPLGGYTKPQVRQLADELGLPTADKPDSQGICFIGEVSIKEFLSEYIETVPGPIKHAETKETLGEHEGAEFYTIGQRQGLDIGGSISAGRDASSIGSKGGLPLYVSGKDMDTNTVFVTEDLQNLMSDNITVTDIHWINDSLDESDSLRVRTRHRGQLVPAVLAKTHENSAELKLEWPERAVTAGQSAVLYKDTGSGLEVMGGGVIAPST